MKKLMIAVAAVAAGSLTFAETAINRAPGQEDAFNAGEAVTNASGTVQFRKFGKVKAKDEVVVNVTDAVLAKGINVWTDENAQGEEIEPKDGIWGFKATYTNSVGGISGWFKFTTFGHEFLNSSNNSGDKSELCAYFAETKDGAMNNVSWQWGTNITDKAITSPKLVLPKDALKADGAAVDIKQVGCDKFVSLADLVEVIKVIKAGKAADIAISGGTITLPAAN